MIKIGTNENLGYMIKDTIGLFGKIWALFIFHELHGSNMELKLL